MKTFLRICYLFLAPVSAFVIMMAATGLFVLKFCENPVENRVVSAVDKHLERHDKSPLSLFHDDIFIAAKGIHKGEKLEASSLEKQNYPSTNAESEKVEHFDNQQVTGSVAKNAITKGHLIFAEDLDERISSKNAEDADKAVNDGQTPAFIAYASLGALAVVALLAVIAFAVSHLWISIDAFKKSVMWGIGCLMVPFVRTVFELKHWEQTKKPIQLQVIAFALAGLAFGSLASAKVKTMRLEDQLATTNTVVFCKKDVKRGAKVTAENIDEREISVRKIPADAITATSQAIGQKAKYGIAVGQIISSDDLAQ